MKPIISNTQFTLGILGGGQLGKMLILSTANYDVNTKVLDPNPQCSSATFCNTFVEGSFKDYDTVLAFGKDCDVLTVEIEHVNTDALKELQKQGVLVHPNPNALEVIKDKGLQKQFYADHGIATSDFVLSTGEEETKELVASGKVRIPFVQKSRTAGYDGKGVFVVKSEDDLNRMLPGASVIEEAVNIEKELAVIVAKDATTGKFTTFDVVEMEFNPVANLVEFLFAPANITTEQEQAARELAIKTATAYDIQGLLAVELFLDKEGNLLVNEVAPRPHNSGHHTIDSCVTSQFEQHFRSICHLPLGNTRLTQPAVMGNILGAAGHTGDVFYEGVNQVMAEEGAKFHIYGKKDTKPFRKMGHFTVVNANLEEAKKAAKRITETLNVISK